MKVVCTVQLNSSYFNTAFFIVIFYVKDSVYLLTGHCQGLEKPFHFGIFFLYLTIENFLINVESLSIDFFSLQIVIFKIVIH